MSVILLPLIYSLYLPLILKFEQFRPISYKNIQNEEDKNKWMKRKIVCEIINIIALYSIAIYSLVEKYTNIHYLITLFFLLFWCGSFITSIILNFLNNKKYSGKFGLFHNKF